MEEERFSIDRFFGFIRPFKFEDFLGHSKKLKEIADSFSDSEERVLLGFPVQERIKYENLSKKYWDNYRQVELVLVSKQHYDSGERFQIHFSHNKYIRDRGRLFFSVSYENEEMAKKIEETFKKKGISHRIGDGWKKDPYLWRASAIQSIAELEESGSPVPDKIKNMFS